MNTSKIKAYAPKARTDFIEAVTRYFHLGWLDLNPEGVVR